MRLPTFTPFALFALAIVALAPAADAKKKGTTTTTKTKTTTLDTGDALPSKPVTDKQCNDAGVRWLGSDPITPFAVVNKKGSIHSAGQHCCAPWARKGSAWNAIDAYGQIVGDAVIAGGEGYDVTQCYELAMDVKKGTDGVGLWVDAKAKWSVASAEWKPSEKDRAAVTKLIGALETTMVRAGSWSCPDADAALPIADRSLYFVAQNATQDAPELDAVVVGGPLLVVAHREANGKWVADHVDNEWSNQCEKRAYKPLAVFDLNDDGSPEILFHYDYGDAFGDSALQRDGFSWGVVAESVHGSTA